MNRALEVGVGGGRSRVGALTHFLYPSSASLARPVGGLAGGGDIGFPPPYGLSSFLSLSLPPCWGGGKGCMKKVYTYRLLSPILQ